MSSAQQRSGHQQRPQWPARQSQLRDRDGENGTEVFQSQVGPRPLDMFPDEQQVASLDMEHDHGKQHCTIDEQGLIGSYGEQPMGQKTEPDQCGCNEERTGLPQLTLQLGHPQTEDQQAQPRRHAGKVVDALERVPPDP